MSLKIKSNESKAPWLKISHMHRKTELKSVENFKVTKDWMLEGDESICFKQNEKFKSIQEESVDYISYL